VDAGYGEYLATCEDSSIDALALSNICEWLDQAGIDRLFEQVVRVAKPGARLCFRNFVGHTEIPERFRNSIIEDRGAGERAILQDRSCLQSRIVICRIAK
jgi:S-adenosylmethionine-diacylglycerol 3-amino-3-carboxypropyl transferase